METYSVRLAELLPEYCDLDVVALRGRDDGRAPSGLSVGLFGFHRFFSVLIGKSVEVTHIGDLAAWPLALAGKLRNPRSSVVVSAHGTDVSFALREGIANQVYGAYVRLFGRLFPSAKIIANSQATADALGLAGLRAACVIPLAADGPSHEITATPNGHVLFAGRLVRRKGLSWFVDNVLERLPSGTDLRVAGPEWDESEKHALRHPRVQYLGALDPEELRQAYADALCVIVPNLDMGVEHFEGFGLVAPEAATCGAVVLGANVGGLKDAIRDGETGFLLEPGDADVWCEKIVSIRDWSEEDRHAFVSASQEVCRTRFSWARVAKETFELY